MPWFLGRSFRAGAMDGLDHAIVEEADSPLVPEGLYLAICDDVMELRQLKAAIASPASFFSKRTKRYLIRELSLIHI